MKTFQQTLGRFLQERRINLGDPKVKTSFWYNPNSADTTHSAQKVKEKENDLAAAFKEAVYQPAARVPTKSPTV